MPLWFLFVSTRLLEEFENHIEELKQLDEKIQRRVEKLEHQCHREAKEFAHKVQDLQRSNQVLPLSTRNHNSPLGQKSNHFTGRHGDILTTFYIQSNKSQLQCDVLQCKKHVTVLLQRGRDLAAPCPIINFC